MVHQAIQGYNGTIFAYGQTSSGKTYAMMGDEQNPGVIVLTAKELFNAMAAAPDRQFLMRWVRSLFIEGIAGKKGCHRVKMTLRIRVISKFNQASTRETKSIK